GSGAGRTAFYSGQIPVAGSDASIADGDRGKADARCSGGKAIDLPMVLTPVEFIYNVKGVSDLTVTPSILAKIFSSFLAAQVPDLWTYGTGQAWKAPGGQGAADSSALVQSVKGMDGAIGYVDGPDATKNSLTPAKLDVGSGPVEPNPDTVGKAISAAQVSGDDQDIVLKINYGLKDAGAYPAILATYEITCTKGMTTGQAKFVKSFLTYTASDAGQAELAKLGY